ncbi:MAG: phosphoribosyl-ATP diphosphatase [Pelagibacteraceae bacterium]|jgi:phosphoribosyl-ATP pyrophosphohydrolase|nr:phosphoribosyl-ATP diphosphatase [Pelagibacteraceae bacterium]MDP6710413.1 phosphoribosyl-ATP diphosphatase [Pelagibacteraceae bacterium]|tara:strand:+ start:202 stop:513 length:312 start_codon:yes stop_codon:yes gene_type:complete
MSETIERLVKTIRSRKESDTKSSYTSFLLSKGNDYCLNKLKEEIAELEDAIKNKKNTVHETADVIYHLLVTLQSANINFDDIIKELKKREDISGFEEKQNRQP